ncbi:MULTISPECIES: LPS export ABC transporter permease LptG [Pseudoxanthomonas]|jgi:lipopolysaccharide export system permease protein|uniref:LPS export ABC transporter permease LptG n=1 Tax=Pseudoxanthomonas winnipegensis TaxID=2480810 RepID=A0A4Q8LHN1_9GAMM|nr:MULTISPECIES: LPS export ABC transporter permease LptG [Pseudoxanthomonas]PZP60870.1 MAG: LPS export ABC transporter permease LptG [Pseudoxanthomonas spadix]HCH0557056.1 LPS export ABC transporter permease LptG [Pseudomonas aeruginosa]TAA28729.1 LPS export ABC transporter permease LptG [Pseudoxanthomonas winnipegensis]TMN17332.1 LPS export ABC transporter permease LptG [Pseudoxanthomonas sp. X-1]UAY74122.1 LPS export ABC transporter permease LptG [Pseudoxanthomonas sp. X-1]
MRFAPRIHDLYVGKVVLGTVLLVWAVLLGLDVTNGISGQLRDVGRGNFTFAHAIAFTLYTVPRRAYTLFPTAAVIGALMGLGQLAASSELTALRALGLSRRRLSLSVAVTLAILTGGMVVCMETAGAWGQTQADNLKAAAKFGNVARGMYAGLWAREGDTFLSARSGDLVSGADGNSQLQLQDVRLYQLDPDGRLASITHAANAIHVTDSWLLRDVTRTTLGARSVQQDKLPQENWPSKLDPAALAATLGQPRYMSAADLSRSIDYRTRNSLDARDYEEVYWGRWFYPINVLALCLAAIPFAFGSLRSGGMGKRLFLGIMFALAFWLLQLLFGRMGTALRLDYRLAYTATPVLMLVISYWLFRRRSS